MKDKTQIHRVLNNMPTALISHPDFLLHDTGPFHPERPKRISSILSSLGIVEYEKTSASPVKLRYLSPSVAEEAQIKAVHSSAYVDSVASWCKEEYKKLPTGDTLICRESEMVARLAAGAVTRAVDAVLLQEVDNVFCAIRPPGHHAESVRGMGFCVYNNVAIAAKYAQSRFGVERVAILDWDVHHGNGTQEIFEEDSTVYYTSIHQTPLYPFTGAEWERGRGQGEGYTLNVPVPSGSGDHIFIDMLNSRIIPAIRKFQPDLLILSAGFDAHLDDPLSGTLVTDEGFISMSRIILDFAEEVCNGNLVSTLEGGYDLDVLGRCVADHVIIMTS